MVVWVKTRADSKYETVRVSHCGRGGPHDWVFLYPSFSRLVEVSSRNYRLPDIRVVFGFLIEF